MFAQIWNLVRKELIQFRRDRLLTPFILLGPVFQLVMLASASAREISHLPVAILDQDQSAASRRLITAFGNARQLDVSLGVGSIEYGTFLLDSDQIDMLVIIPPNFGAELSSVARRPQIQLIIDGSNAIAASTLQQIAQGVLERFQRQQLAQMGFAGMESGAGIDLRPVIYYNQTLNFQYTALPAQLGLIVYMVTMLVASLGISRERERGTMEQLRVTPLRRIELMLGKAVPVVIIALADFVVMFVIVTHVYAIPMRGSVALLIGLTVLYILAEMGGGLTISSLATSQRQSLLLVFLVGVLNVAFSGYLVPVENMPWILSKASYLFPVQHYMRILRLVMLKGAGLMDVMSDVVALILLGIAIASTAYSVVHSRLD